jgi:hypothetical protein
MTAIEGRAVRNEAKWACALERSGNTSVERPPGKNASGESSTKHVIEAVRLGGFTPPGSPFDRHGVVVFPLRMNNPGQRHGTLGKTLLDTDWEQDC